MRLPALACRRALTIAALQGARQCHHRHRGLPMPGKYRTKLSGRAMSLWLRQERIESRFGGRRRKHVSIARKCPGAVLDCPRRRLRARPMAGDDLPQPARLPISRPRLSGEPPPAGGLGRALLPLTARAARTCRSCDGDRAGASGRGRAGRRRCGGCDVCHGLRRRHGRRPRSGIEEAWRLAQGFSQAQQDAHCRPQLHGRAQLSRAYVRLSQHRARPLPGRLGRRHLPVRRHTAVLAAHRRR
jgi:hypothetical protein